MINIINKWQQNLKNSTNNRGIQFNVCTLGKEGQDIIIMFDIMRRFFGGKQAESISK